MNIEVGKVFKTRSGGYKVTILCVDRKDPEQPVVGMLEMPGQMDFAGRWTADGFYVRSGVAQGLDLIELSEPHQPTNWMERDELYERRAIKTSIGIGTYKTVSGLDARVIGCIGTTPKPSAPKDCPIVGLVDVDGREHLAHWSVEGRHSSMAGFDLLLEEKS
jgi:hypothetical protein